MSIFGTSQPVTQEEVTAPLFEGYSAEQNGDIIALQESFEDQLAVIEALHGLDMEEVGLQTDVATLEGAGATQSQIEDRQAEYEVVTENMAQTAWVRIKDYFAKLWGKLQAFFQSAIRLFDALTKSGSDFAKKNEKGLKELNLKGFEFKKHVYTQIENADFTKVDLAAEAKELLNAAVAVSTDVNSDDKVKALKDHIVELRENRSDIVDDIRGSAVGKSSLNAEQFAESLYGIFRNGASNSKDAQERPVNINEVLAELKATEGKKQAEAFKKSVDKEFGAVLKTIKELQSKLAKAPVKDDTRTLKHGDSEHKVSSSATPVVLEALRSYGGLFSASKDVQLQLFRAWRSAYNERAMVNKRICLAAFHYKADKK